MATTGPSLSQIADARQRLAEHLLVTPTRRWSTRRVEEHLGRDTELLLKLELFQRAGTFKPRGAMLNMLALSDAELSRGVTAVSAGNHAIATAFAARQLGTSAKVVMISTANPLRIQACRDFGADLVMVDDPSAAFETVHAIAEKEGRSFIHPFDGENVALGTGTLGVEFLDQVGELDAVIVPIGGGGLCAGLSNAIKQAQPRCRVYGVEPEGADSMHRSFAAGSPQSIPKVRTIADSLGAPHAAEYSFELCRANVDELVMVDDDQIRDAMVLQFVDAKLACEPAGATATAALWGPLRETLRGERVGLIICGSNIDVTSFYDCVRPRLNNQI